MREGIGYSQSENSYEAGKEAALSAVKSSGKPGLTFLFTTDFYNQRKVLKGVKEVVESSRIIGFCSGGIITEDGVLQKGIGVATLSSERIRAMTSLQKGLGENPGDVGKSTGEALLSSGINEGTVFIFPDGFAPNLLEMIHGLYNMMGPQFSFAGGASGDNLRFFKTYQFTEDNVESNALATALLGGVPIGTGIGHGWKPAGETLVITKAEEKRVFEINGLPAFKAYTDFFGKIPEEKFPEYGMKYPLGFPGIHGDFFIRDPLKVNPDGSIDFVTEVPTNAIGHIMKGSIKELIETAGTVAKIAVGKIAKPQLVLVLDCISRYLLMGKEFKRELKAIKKAIGNIPMIGALTFGEIGSFKQVPLFHNKTTLIVAIGNNDSEK